jgi:hypothetical protein
MNWKGFGRNMSLPYWKALSRHSPGGFEKNHEKPVRLAGLRADISTRDLPNTKRECWPVGHDVRGLAIEVSWVIVRSTPLTGHWSWFAGQERGRDENVQHLYRSVGVFSEHLNTKLFVLQALTTLYLPACSYVMYDYMHFCLFKDAVTSSDYIAQIMSW